MTPEYQSRRPNHAQRTRPSRAGAIHAPPRAGSFGRSASSAPKLSTERIEPDVVGHDKKTGEYVFFDCSPESPKGRTSLCYDREALESRKEHKPKSSAMDLAAAMGIDLLQLRFPRRLPVLRQVVSLDSHALRLEPSEVGGELNELRVNIRPAHAGGAAPRGIEHLESLVGRFHKITS